MDIDMINTAIKNLFLNFFSVIFFFRLTNQKDIRLMKRIFIFIFMSVISGLYMIMKAKFDIVTANFMVYFCMSLMLMIITHNTISKVIIATIISRCFSYILLLLAGVIDFFIQQLTGMSNKIVNILLTMLIECVLVYGFLRIRKIKNGLAFLKESDDFLDVILINVGILIFILYGLIGSNYGKVFENIFIYFAILGICMVITVQKIIGMHYKQKLVNDTINQYKEELQQKDDEIKKLTEEAFRVSKINHEFYNRQKALELAVKNITSKANAESGEDIDLVNRIHEITEEHSKKMDELKNLDELPKTEIKEIDDMFSYMQSECKKDKINFKLKINGNIHILVNNLIDKSKLETLIGDHLRDAIIAINSGGNTNKELFVILGVKNDIYELCVYDTGVEFKIETLLRLGLEPATTHKETGGTGIGFMTTFETLNETKASLIIEEISPEDSSNYTKSVTIRFDGKCEYRIKSYRAQEIKKYKESKRIKVVND